MGSLQPFSQDQSSTILIPGNREYKTLPHDDSMSVGSSAPGRLIDRVEEERVTKFGIGQPVPRLEDPRFITGRGRYVDDIDLPQQCHGVVVMSPHAHARIKSIDTAKAKAADGVVAVLTGADVEADKLGSLVPLMPEDMGGPRASARCVPILSGGKVRAVGDRVAFVVAETLPQARDAAELDR